MSPDEIIAREMQKLKEMGVTVHVSLSPHGPGNRASAVIKDAAKEAGIHYGDEDDEPEWPGVER